MEHAWDLREGKEASMSGWREELGTGRERENTELTGDHII
jgi:hypothetical protein